MSVADHSSTRQPDAWFRLDDPLGHMPPFEQPCMGVAISSNQRRHLARLSANARAQDLEAWRACMPLRRKSIEREAQMLHEVHTSGARRAKGAPPSVATAPNPQGTGATHMRAADVCTRAASGAADARAVSQRRKPRQAQLIEQGPQHGRANGVVPRAQAAHTIQRMFRGQRGRHKANACRACRVSQASFAWQSHDRFRQPGVHRGNPLPHSLKGVWDTQMEPVHLGSLHCQRDALQTHGSSPAGTAASYGTECETSAGLFTWPAAKHIGWYRLPAGWQTMHSYQFPYQPSLAQQAYPRSSCGSHDSSQSVCASLPQRPVVHRPKPVRPTLPQRTVVHRPKPVRPTTGSLVA
jgi:hypothetical protein